MTNLKQTDFIGLWEGLTDEQKKEAIKSLSTALDRAAFSMHQAAMALVKLSNSVEFKRLNEEREKEKERVTELLKQRLKDLKGE